jgi:hypothetical protein
MQLSPIVFFAYNRPWHTEQTLLSLMENEQASQSVIYFFIDGCKPDANHEQIEKNKRVIDLVNKYKHYFHESFVEISPQNKGLANSVIYGITKVIDKHGKVIVLEDDIVTSPGYLQYMNEALCLYENENKVAGISGFSFIEYSDSYFLRTGSCWGWGTWKRVWNEINWDIDSLLQKLHDKKIRRRFNLDNAYPFYNLLLKQKEKVVDSWAIRFYASYFIAGQLFLHPSKTMVLNSGIDEGTHYCSGNRIDIKQKESLLSQMRIVKQEIVENDFAKNDVINYLRKTKQKTFFHALRHIFPSISNK